MARLRGSNYDGAQVCQTEESQGPKRGYEVGWPEGWNRQEYEKHLLPGHRKHWATDVNDELLCCMTDMTMVGLAE